MAVLEEFKDKKDAVALTDDFKKNHEEINAIKNPKDMDEAKFKSISSKLFDLRNKFTG